jgi:hypothetical protein
MKTIVRNSIHTKDKSHDCLILEIRGKKIKITYQAYNAVEKCNTEFFDGDKWNHIFSILDLGVNEEISAYSIWDENERKKRADDLFKESKELSNSILN